MLRSAADQTAPSKGLLAQPDLDADAAMRVLCRCTPARVRGQYGTEQVPRGVRS